MSQRLYDTAIAVLGPGALLMPEAAGAMDRGRWARGLLSTRANSIMGGTSEIQRNIIGERLLGSPMPRNPEMSDHLTPPDFVDPLDLVDPVRYARGGYPHEVWTRLRRGPGRAHRGARVQAVLGDHEARRHHGDRASRRGSRANTGSRSRAPSSR